MKNEPEIEHDPWHGPQYGSGINNQRIAIIGYSHHHAEKESDVPSFTNDVINNVIANDPHQFFRSIRGYFGYKDVKDFWDRVLFFNFLPDCIGTTDRRYADGSPQQINRARSRFKRLIGKYLPHKALVFTAKGWRECPPTREEDAGGTCPLLGSEFGRFSWGTYDIDGIIVKAFGLRHPQYARDDIMRNVVLHVLTV